MSRDPCAEKSHFSSQLKEEENLGQEKSVGGGVGGAWGGGAALQPRQ